MSLQSDPTPNQIGRASRRLSSPFNAGRQLVSGM